MGMMDEMKDKGDDMLNNSDVKDKIQHMADEHGISFDEAKERFLKQQNQ